jgi:hypothetical protein
MILETKFERCFQQQQDKCVSLVKEPVLKIGHKLHSFNLALMYVQRI